MEEHDAPFSNVAYQQPDGTTGVLNNHDEKALHDVPGAVREKHIADGAVTNGKIAKGAVTSAELADGAVTAETIADGAVGRDQLAQEIKDDWDSISQETATLRNTIASVSTVANRADAKVYFANKARKLSLNSWGSGMQIDSTQTDGKVLQLSVDAGGLHFFVDGREVWSK